MRSPEDFRPLYWTMLGLGAVALLILALGVLTLLRFAPLGQHTGYHAQVDGVFPYNARSGQVDGPPSTHFRRDQPFAAQVEWDRLPAGMVVSARWYDSLDSEVGSVGPAPAGQLADRRALVPVVTPADLHANLPGSYTLKIVRYSGGQPVELLDSESVVVLHDP
ncbi:MAG TPA: hypothetical protein VE953_10535 [Terriglobales bacterium]|nr:hypothetical protein [Terriglobales bacterium]